MQYFLAIKIHSFRSTFVYLTKNDSSTLIIKLQIVELFQHDLRLIKQYWQIDCHKQNELNNNDADNT